MILCLLLMFSVLVDSIERPYPEGIGKISNKFHDLHRQAEKQEWSHNWVELQKILRSTNSRYGQESSDRNSLITGSFSTRNRKPASQYFGQGNYGFKINRPEYNLASESKFESISRRPHSTGPFQTFAHTNPDNAGHPAFYVPNSGTGESRGSENKRKQELIIKVGGDKIRLRPEDYKIEDWSMKSKSAPLTNNIYPSFASLVDEPYSSTPNTEISSPNKESYSSLSPKEPSPALSTSSSVVETGYSHSERSNLTGQIAYEQQVDHQSQETADSEDLSLPTQPKHFAKNTTQAHSLSIQDTKNLKAKIFKVRENWREIIINGQPQSKHGAKGSISEHQFPFSFPDGQDALDLQTSDEQWKLYPPLLIEEINLPTIKDFEYAENSDRLNVSRELLPGETVTNETGSKFSAHHSETEIAQNNEFDYFQTSDFPEETEISQNNESDYFQTSNFPEETEISQNNEFDYFQTSNFSEGSGSEEPIEERGGKETTDFLNIDSDEELIAGRKLTSDSSHIPFSEREGSGFFSFEDRRENASSRHISPRIIDLFATPNDSSTPCSTPKGEPGHCRDIRYCILQEVLNNFNLYLQYVCLIRRRFVGICCPDNPVISQTPEPDEENSAESANTQIVEFSQPLKGCGISTKTRIVGGSISKPHEWTWMVALLRKNRFFCGGVLINNWYVLTAAHCTLGIRPRDLKIRLGEYSFLETKEHQEDIGVQEIKRHAQFITLTFQHDIALLKLKRSVQFSRFVSSICLPQADEKYRDVNATVVGWGTVSFGGAASPVLREVTIPVWRNEDCDRTYLFEDINDSFLCAGSPEPNQDACQGDSGGPLMALNGDGRWEAIGIVSWGRRCGDPSYPGVYTRISTYLGWIQKNMT